METRLLVFLIAADDEMLYQIFSRKLQKMDCTPVAAHTVKDGLEKAARGTKDRAEQAVRTETWSYIAKPAFLQSRLLSLKRALEYRQNKLYYARPKVLKREGILGKSWQLGSCLGHSCDVAYGK